MGGLDRGVVDPRGVWNAVVGIVSSRSHSHTYTRTIAKTSKPDALLLYSSRADSRRRMRAGKRFLNVAKPVGSQTGGAPANQGWRGGTVTGGAEYSPQKSWGDVV